MDKQEIAAFFDRYASSWDANLVTDDNKIRAILDAAGVKADAAVLDVACGTGVLFPYYLERDVSCVLGVDISPEMARIAAEKRQDDRIRVICGDVEELPVQLQCDCCVVYNAFPHFAEPRRLVERLARWVRPGGRLTVAHGMSLEMLDRHHAGSAVRVSRKMLTPAELAELCAPWFAVDIQVADDEKYIVSGVRRDG